MFSTLNHKLSCGWSLTRFLWMTVSEEWRRSFEIISWVIVLDLGFDQDSAASVPTAWTEHLGYRNNQQIPVCTGEENPAHMSGYLKVSHSYQDVEMDLLKFSFCRLNFLSWDAKTIASDWYQFLWEKNIRFFSVFFQLFQSTDVISIRKHGKKYKPGKNFHTS